MARNAIESDFRSSKMAGGHFVKNLKLRIDLKWREMRSKVIFGHPKWRRPFGENKFAAFRRFSLAFTHFSQLFPTFPHFFPLSPHFFQLFPTFSPLFDTFSHFFPLFTLFSHFSPLFTTFSHF